MIKICNPPSSLPYRTSCLRLVIGSLMLRIRGSFFCHHPINVAWHVDIRGYMQRSSPFPLLSCTIKFFIMSSHLFYIWSTFDIHSPSATWSTQGDSMHKFIIETPQHFLQVLDVSDSKFHIPSKRSQRLGIFY